MGDESESSDSNATMASLTRKLHVGIPGTDAYVFRGPKGTFVVNTDRRDLTERVLDEE